MHVETYPAFFTPRDKEPSLSSSEEKSSEFDWLEIKITRKQKYIYEKQSKCSVVYFSSLYKRLSPRTSSREIFYLFVKKITTIYIRGYSPLCSYLKTKESYDKWVTRIV